MIVLGHRGFFLKTGTENTLSAFRSALARGVDGIECDIRVSRDGVPIVFHDRTLRRIADDKRRPKDVLFSDLKTLELIAGDSIPTLNDVTASILAPAILNFEIKDRKAVEPVILKLKTSAALRQRVIVSSFVLNDLMRVCAELPDVPRVLLRRNWPLPLRKRRFWKSLDGLGLSGVGFPPTSLSLRRVAFLHKKGLKIFSWDVRLGAFETERMMSLGVDVMITFRCDMIRTLDAS